MKLTHRLILASASPRRSFLLESLGLKFEVKVPDVEEIIPAGLPHEDAPAYLAELKARGAAHWLKENTIILTADSVVLHNGELLGKPTDLEAAKHALRKLCGSEHTVVTGFTISSLGPSGEPIFSTHTVNSQVSLLPSTEVEIAYYLEHQPPLDKAGSYGVQDWIGWAKVNRIEGSYSNIMGLPTAEVWQALLDSGFIHQK